MSTINKIKKAKISGCGGACFPVADKWKMVKEAKSASGVKYVIMNASEGEPRVEKDGYIFANHSASALKGMKKAVDYLSDKNISVKSIIYINPAYYRKYGKKLKKEMAEIFNGFEAELFKKPHGSGYIAGEETTLLNVIEGKRAVPRLRPPYPTTEGLWGCPTLVNNVETFYRVNQACSGKSAAKRFFSINGDCSKPGVYEFPADRNIKKILKDTGNIPKFNFFVQVGGGASGRVLDQDQLKLPGEGAMSLTLYRLGKHKPEKVIEKWLDFFIDQSCGQCTPCREGVYRLLEIIRSKEPDWRLFSELLDNLEDSSFCGLGCVVPVPIRSYIGNVVSKKKNSDIRMEKSKRKTICECFK